jgi:hypothetical protein
MSEVRGVYLLLWLLGYINSVHSDLYWRRVFVSSRQEAPNLKQSTKRLSNTKVALLSPENTGLWSPWITNISGSGDPYIKCNVLPQKVFLGNKFIECEIGVTYRERKRDEKCTQQFKWKIWKWKTTWDTRPRQISQDSMTVITDEIEYKIVYRINLGTTDGRLEQLSDY